MIILISYLLLYVAVPFIAYRAVWHWTGSAAAALGAVIVTIPAGVLLYARIFEHLKRGSRACHQARDFSRP